MKVHERCLAGFLALGLLATACNGSSDPIAEPTETPTAVPTEVVEAPTEIAEEPTPDPRDAVTDTQLIDAALIQLEADVAAEAIPSVFAYDVLDTGVNEDGDVTVGICAWTGDSVFDTVRDSLYRTSIADDGTITAQHITTPVASGECLNTQLINSALDHINEFDEFWTEIVAEPERFADDPRQELMTEQFAAVSRETIENLIADQVYSLGTRVTGDIEETRAAELLWRRFVSNDVAVLEIGVCRDMDPERGLYRDGVLLDSGQTDESPNLHSLDSFQVVPNTGSWLITGRKALAWSDCFFLGSWADGANAWQERATEFEVLPQ